MKGIEIGTFPKGDRNFPLEDGSCTKKELVIVEVSPWEGEI
jgi:hypothetical protein